MPYLTPAELREKVPSLADPNVYPDADLEEYVAEFEQLAERYRGVAYLPRTRTWVGRAGTIMLPDPMVTAITAVDVDGVALTGDEITALDLAATGFVHDWWRSGVITVTYTHGYTEPPPAILRACREYVRAVALERDSGVPRNAASWSDGQGGTYRTFTADWDGGRPTGFVTVDQALNEMPDHRVPTIA